MHSSHKKYIKSVFESVYGRILNLVSVVVVFSYHLSLSKMLFLLNHSGNTLGLPEPEPSENGKPQKVKISNATTTTTEIHSHKLQQQNEHFFSNTTKKSKDLELKGKNNGYPLRRRRHHPMKQQQHQ